LAKDNFLIIYFNEITFDDLGNKIEKEKIFNLSEANYKLSDIVKNGGFNQGAIWYPYHQIYKIIYSFKEKINVYKI
jgi:hypothetical protein